VPEGLLVVRGDQQAVHPLVLPLPESLAELLLLANGTALLLMQLICETL
jgi:hypothetical protein